MNVPTVKTWNGTRVVVGNGTGHELDIIADDVRHAQRIAAHLRGALADAFLAGRAEGFADGQRLPNIEPHEYERGGARREPENVPCASCGRTDLPLHTNHQCPECHTPTEETP